MTTYYIPINSINLPTIYRTGLIMPKKYIKSENIDVQNQFPSYLLITTKKITNNSDCVLEVTLSNEEIKSLKALSKKSDAFLFTLPLPISRIKHLYFVTEETKERIIAIINLSTAFIDKSIASIFNKYETKTDGKSLVNDKILEAKDCLAAVNKFDSVMGGFAVMRVAHEDSMNYSDTYFSTLSLFNEKIKSEVLNSGLNINDKFQDAFFGLNKFKNLFPYLHRPITENDINDFAKFENQTVIKDKLTGIIDIDSLDKMTYILAVLFTYGVGEEAKKKKIDSLIVSNFKNDIKSEFSEIIALCYGINRGYGAFVKNYSLGTKESFIKFKLQTQLDYYTIESLYQFAFYNKYENNGFEYIDSFVTTEKSSVGDGSVNIMGQNVLLKKKPKVGTTEYLHQLSHSFIQKNNESPLTVFIGKLIEGVKADLDKEYKSDLEAKDNEIKTLTNRITTLEPDFKSNNQVSENAESYERSTKDLHLVEKVNELEYLLAKIKKETKASEIQKIIKTYNDLKLFK